MINLISIQSTFDMTLNFKLKLMLKNETLFNQKLLLINF